MNELNVRPPRFLDPSLYRRKQIALDGVLLKKLWEGQAYVDPTLVGPRCCDFPSNPCAEHASDDNWADLLTHHCGTQAIDSHLAGISAERRPSH